MWDDVVSGIMVPKYLHILATQNCEWILLFLKQCRLCRFLKNFKDLEGEIFLGSLHEPSITKNILKSRRKGQKGEQRWDLRLWSTISGSEHVEKRQWAQCAAHL